MRPLKFKVWNYAEHRFLLSNYGWAWNILEDLNDGLNNRYHICQFTGLKDRNDKEIYEGDIVKITGYKEFQSGVVRWDYLNAAFLVNERCGIYGPEQSVEVIGNIFETPELLK